MSFDLNHEEHLRELQKRLHRARMITPDLIAKVIAQVCPRLQAQRLALQPRDQAKRPLCRPYDDGRASVSNSYALINTLGAAENNSVFEKEKCHGRQW